MDKKEQEWKEFQERVKKINKERDLIGLVILSTKTFRIKISK